MPKALFVILIMLACVPQAHALKQYRCGGFVQYRPCDPNVQPATAPHEKLARISALRAAARPHRYAKVLQNNFSYDGKKRGVWTGRVEGNGTIHLRLHLVSDGKKETRYMGNIQLAHKSTSFRFESSVPESSAWKWSISVQAT